MQDPLTPELESLVAGVRGQLLGALRRHGRVVYANSLGAESMVLTDIICTHVPGIDLFSIDTGRLPGQTHELIERLERRYHRRLPLVHPEAVRLDALSASQGANGFYHSLEARLACCQARKIEPFRRAIAGYNAWVTGVRREQSQERARMQTEAWDGEHGLYKLAPLLTWTDSEVWQYIRTLKLPYNALHDQGYPSIGCAPCTRGIHPGEAPRAGRWWWEQPGTRECGLQSRPVAEAPPQADNVPVKA